MELLALEKKKEQRYAVVFDRCDTIEKERVRKMRLVVKNVREEICRRRETAQRFNSR